MKFDQHVHTSKHSPDSEIDPFELVRRAIEAGLQGVIITEHDYQWEPSELDELRREADGLTVLSGAEISALEGHFLVYGLPDLEGIEPGIPVGKLVEIVRRHDAAIVAAHPFRWEQEFEEILDAQGLVFDALELVSNNITPDTRHLTHQLAQKHGLAMTGSSDGHQPEVVGCYFTEYLEPVRSMSDVVSALRRRSIRPGHRRGVPLASGPVL